MVVTSKPFLALTAADLMSQAVVVVARHMSLAGAARLLSQAQVTGAPVVDDEGRCVGVLSATDFLNHARQAPRRTPYGGCPDTCYSSAWQMIEPDALPREQVTSIMTADPVTVSPDTSIGELARMMRDARIHRVIVVDEQQRPSGIVSSMDVLAALAHEHQQQQINPAY